MTNAENIRTVVERAAYSRPDKVYLYFGDAKVTCDEFDETINRTANAFLSLGVGKGERVALLLPNRPEFLYTWLGLNKIGASMVPINTAFKGEEVRYVLSHSDARAVVTDREHLDVLLALQGQSPALGRILCWDEVSAGDVADLRALMQASSVQLAPVEIAPDDEAAILYTSGTTGHPKGCVEPHSYYTLAGTVYARHLRLGPDDRVLTPLPLFHMNPQVLSTMGTLMTGGSLILVDRFHSSRWWEEVRQKRATVFHYLGVMPAMLMGMPERPDDANQPARIGLGAGIPASLHARFEARFGVKMIEVFGMTETGLNFCCPLEGERHVGTQCFGPPLPEYAARVVDDDGADVPVGETGELVLRGTGRDRRLGFMRGYYKDERATEGAWRGGWFHTGDVVRRDAEGNYYFVDRRKDIVRRSGENISSSEVEAVIRAHPKVLDAAVIPVPDPIREQEVKACVILKPGESIETVPPAEIIAWCAERLAYFKVPRYVEYRVSFPRTPTEKVQKAVLRAEREDLTEGCYDRATGAWR